MSVASESPMAVESSSIRTLDLMPISVAVLRLVSRVVSSCGLFVGAILSPLVTDIARATLLYSVMGKKCRMGALKGGGVSIRMPV